METANVMVTHNTERDNYYLYATQERSLISIYTLTKYRGLQPWRRYSKPEWRHPLRIARAPRKRSANHVPPSAKSMPSKGPADEPLNYTTKAYCHALALGPAPSPRPFTKAR